MAKSKVGCANQTIDENFNLIFLKQAFNINKPTKELVIKKIIDFQTL
jgi:hypothetical protein